MEGARPGAKPVQQREYVSRGGHRGTGQHDDSPQRAASGTPTGQRGREKPSLPPQQRHLDRCHQAEDDDPLQPAKPPLPRSLGRLRQQSRRVGDDRHDHHGDHVPEVKGHHIVIRYEKHALDEAGAQHAVERGRECHHQSGLRAAKASIATVGGVVFCTA